MNRPAQPITHERLFEAAEAVAAVVTEAVARAGVWVSIAQVLHGPNLHSRLQGFSMSEVEEAARFLFRLGIIEVR